MYGVAAARIIGAGVVIAATQFALGCTEPANRSVISARIDADDEVRSRVAEIEARIEMRDADNVGWQVRATQRFDIDASSSWPLTLKVSEAAGDTSRTTYQLVAIARDSRAALVSQARVWTTFDRARRNALHVLFEAACLRTEPCGPSRTCSGGECVSAEYDPDATPPSATSRNDATKAETMQNDAAPSASGLAEEGATCSVEGERRCAGFASDVPLRCDGARWQRQGQCTSAQRCVTANGADRGMCRAIASECLGQTPNVPFCAAETMRACNADLLDSEIRMCGDNEHCAPDARGEAHCTCLTGFILTNAVCQQSTDCTRDNGGCDRLTECRMSAGTRTCSQCPSGWNGTGETGCVPVLMNLSLAKAELSPPFTPGTMNYRVRVPLLMQSVTLSAQAPADSEVSFNGTRVPSGESWTSPVLALGENRVDVVATSASGVSKVYRVLVERTGAQEARIKASNAGPEHLFGGCTAISRDTLVVGAPLEDNGGSGVNGNSADKPAAESGAAYVFVRGADGWTQQAYLKPSNTASRDYFGTSAAISGDTLVLGAPRQDTRSLASENTRAGSVFVFTRADGVWSQQAELGPPNANVADAFGVTVAIENDTLVVGAAMDGALLTGATYVFTRAAATWSAPLRIVPKEPHEYSLFGSQVAISGDTLASSAQEDRATAYRAGSVYTFVRRGDRWQEQQRIVQEPEVEQALFGLSLELRGDVLVAGAPQLDVPNRDDEPPGDVRVFQRTGEHWAQTAVLKNPVPAPHDSFGFEVALGDGILAVGAATESGSSRGLGGDPTAREAHAAGAAYLFARTPEGWKYSTYIKPDNTGADDYFGGSVAISEDTLVVSSMTEDSSGKGVNSQVDDDASHDSGAIYVFR